MVIENTRRDDAGDDSYVYISIIIGLYGKLSYCSSHGLQYLPAK